MPDLRQALRHARRLVRHSRGFVAIVVTTLGVGIGAATAAMSVAAGVLRNALPVRDESRLVLVTKTLPTGSTLVPFSYAEIAAWREASRTLDGVAGVQYDGAWPWPAEHGDRAITVTGTAVSGNFFEVLGAQPAAGRLLRDEDAVAGAEVVAVVGYGLWRREFAGNPEIVGQTLRLDGRPATIVGVAPHGFAFPDGADVWRPLEIAPDTLNEGWFSLVARLRPNATIAQAAGEAALLRQQLRALGPKHLAELRTITVPFKDAIVGDVRPALVLFVTAAMLLFLAACLNVANLLLVRGTARERDITLRAALGATRSRLIGELTTESATLAVAGGLVGVLVAFWLQRALIAIAPAGIPRLEQIRFDARALGFAAAGSMLGTVLAGVLPALWTVRRTLFGRLRSEWTIDSGTRSAQVNRQVLITAQLAFALLVTVAAALLMRSLVQLQRADLGFSPDSLTIVQVPLVGPEYRDPERRRQFFGELVSRMEALPGIEAVTAVLLRPFTGKDGWDATFTADRQAHEEASANPGIHLEAVLPNYFSTMGIPIRRGRSFSDADGERSLPVVIVTESLARRAWPESDALDKRLKFGSPDSSAPWMTVVGVVGDLRYRDLDAPPPALYVPMRQTPFPARFLIVRTGVTNAPVLSLTRRIVRDLDSDEPVVEAAALAELLRGELAAPRFYMLALGLFAVLTVVLAGVGVFGILAAFVAQRSRELGVRVALGATGSDLHRLVLSQMAWPASVGLTLGTAAALAATRFLQPLLFDVSAIDARALAAGWLTLGVASLVASLIPLRRASRVDPARLLRLE
jgi:putative ABC transport system permease protein